MKIFWKATWLKFLPVILKNENEDIVGEIKSWNKLVYQGAEYNFEFVPKPISKAFTTNKIRVFKGLTEEVAEIIDPQWLRKIQIVVSSQEIFEMSPKLSSGENYDVNHNNTKIGEFRERYFAPTARGHLELDESQVNNIPLIASVLYR